MAFTVKSNSSTVFEVNASYDDVFTLLSNVPEAAGMYPKIDRIVDLGDDKYRWEMQRIGNDKIYLQMTYTCRYAVNKEAGTVIWTPEAGDDNAVVSGRFDIKESGSGTQITLSIDSDLTMPLPKIMKALATPAVKKENKKLHDRYIDRLIDKLGGGKLVSTTRS